MFGSRADLNAQKPSSRENPTIYSAFKYDANYDRQHFDSPPIKVKINISKHISSQMDNML